jgi:hypothetical protein
MKKWEVKVVRTKARIANIGLAKWWLDAKNNRQLAKPCCGSGWIYNFQTLTLNFNKIFLISSGCGRNECNTPLRQAVDRCVP